MKQLLLSGVLAMAVPVIAHAQGQRSLPLIGWSAGPGLSTTGSNICTLFGGLGNHSDLALVADAANSPLNFTLLLDDGAAKPFATSSLSRLTVEASGSRPLSIPGAMRFGQFKTNLSPQALKPFMRLFVKRKSMTVALDGGFPISVNLTGSTKAAEAMKRCEIEQKMIQPAAMRVHVITAARHSPAPTAAISAIIASTNLPPPPALPSAPPPSAPAARPAMAATPSVAAPPPSPSTPALPSPSSAAAATALPTLAMSPAAPAPAPSPQTASSETLLLAKAIEGQFVAINQDGKASYENTSDDALSRGARAARASDLCILLGDDKEAEDWTGRISNLSTGKEGVHDLSVKLADGISIEMTNVKPFTAQGDRVSDPAPDLLKTISHMQVGEPIMFSGRFFPSDVDCIQETSPTADKAMTSPNFLMTFTAVEAMH